MTLTKPFPLSAALRRIGLGVAIVMLAGCAIADRRPVGGVTSPPAPRFGSAPIAAYDDFARAVFPPSTAKKKVLAVIVSPLAESPVVVDHSRKPLLIEGMGAVAGTY